jgi:hypothetical protein
LKEKIKKKEEELKYNSNENNNSENILKRYNNSNENESNDKNNEESNNNNIYSNFKRNLVKRHSVELKAKINFNNIVNDNTDTKQIKMNNENNQININTSNDFILSRKPYKHETNPLPKIKSNSFYGKLKSHYITKDKNKYKNSQLKSPELTNNLRRSEENKKSCLVKTKFTLKMNKILDEYLNYDFFAQKLNSQDNYNNKIPKENNNKKTINCSEKFLKNENLNKSLSPKKKHINHFNQKTENLNTINKDKKEFKNKNYLNWNKNIKSSKKKNENNIKKYCKELKINIYSSILKQSKQGYNSGDFTLPLVSQLKTNKK